MALKDAHYRINAHLQFRGDTGEAQTFDAQFERRAGQGKCFYQPYFGCREFPAYFELVNSAQPRQSPLPLNLDLGWMLYDVFDLARSNGNGAPPAISVFNAKVKNGVLEVAPYGSSAVKKIEEADHA